MSDEKSKKSEKEKNIKDEPLMTLLYSFKKDITSQDPFYPLNNLITRNNIYGWQSSRFCSYPQEIVVDFLSYVNIKQINLLIHEKKIPTVIEFVNCLPKIMNLNNSNTEKNSNIYYKNKNIGFIRLSPNTESNYKSREFRKIHINIFTKRLKLILHKNYTNAYNLFSQVGIISMNFLGYILPEEKSEEIEKLNFSEIMLEEDIDDIDEHLIYDKMDENTKEKMKQLLEELEEQKKREEYEECKNIKNKIDQLKKISFKIYQLENYKNQFSEKNDFDNSQKVKNQIEKLKQKINNEFNNENNNINIINSTANKFNTINTDIIIQNNNNYNNEENIFSHRIKRYKNANNNNNLKLSQSQQDLSNISENKHDDVVLPTIQKKINTNLSTINLNNNSSNSFEFNNSNNSIAVLESFREKNEKINLKDIPPPEDLTEEMKTKFNLLIELFGEEIFKKIFCRHIEYKIIGFQELNSQVTKRILEIKGSTQDTNKYIVSLINIFFIFLDDRRPSLVSESLELFINVLKGIKERSNSNKTEYDFKITKRLLKRIRSKLNHISKQVRTKAEELYSYMLISNFCEYNSIITELVESDVDNFYKKIGINDRANLNLGKCINNILSKGGMSNIKIDATKELIVTKMNIFLKIFSGIEKNKENKTLNEKNFPKDIVGEFIIINVDHPKKEVRFVTKKVLNQYILIFGKDILYKLKIFVGSKELTKLFQDSPELLKIFNEIEEEEKKLEEKKILKYRNYLENKFIIKRTNNNKTLNELNNFNKKNKLLNPLNGTFDINNLGNNNIILPNVIDTNKNIKEGKTLIKSSSQPEYKVSKKIKLKPINPKKESSEIINEEPQNKDIPNLKKKIKLKKKSSRKMDVLENSKVN